MNETEFTGISLQKLCRNLMQRWPQNLSQDELDSLHVLCRKVHTAKELYTVYQTGWKRLPDAPVLQTRDWELLASLFATWSAPRGKRGLEEIGIALKCLNALWCLLERWQTTEEGCDVRQWKLLAENNRKAWFPEDTTEDAAA